MINRIINERYFRNCNMRISNSKLVCLLANNRFLPVKCFSASSSMSSSASVLSASQKNNIPINLKKHDVEILSEDPSCFLVHNFLSPEECKAYISKADDTGRRALMTRSNAPQVSLQLEKLWPLPLFCLGAGIPPVLRLLEDSSNNNGVPSTGAAVVGIGDVVNAALPSVSIAFGVVAALVAAITKGMQKFAETSSRTSRSLALNAEGDCDFIRNLVDQASLITNHRWDCWEAPVITKYESGALFASHNDASVTRGSEWADLGGQRVVTVITYLNTCNQGGGE